MNSKTHPEPLSDDMHQATAGRRVAFLMPRFFSEKVGGMEVQTYLMAKQLSHMGWLVHYIAESEDPEKAGTNTDIDGFTVHWLRMRSHFSLWRRDVISILRRIHPAVLYQRGRSRLTSSKRPFTTAHRLGAKVLYHCAEDNDLNRHHNWRHVVDSDKSFLRKCILGLQALILDFYFAFTVRNSDVLISQSHRQKRMFTEQLGRESVIVCNGLEVPAGPFSKTNPPLILWLANVGRRKQPELFIELARSLQGTIAQFVMAGPIPDSTYLSTLQHLIRTTANLTYIGPQNWDEANQLFGRASVFVNTTQPDREGFPNTYIQAWMRETPVVTLHCDPDGVIEKYRMGCHSRTFEQLVADVQLLIENHGLRSELGLNARAYALKHHDIRTTSRMVHEILTALVAGSEESA